MFTASRDIQQALGLLASTALRRPRTADNSIHLDELEDAFACPQGRQALIDLAVRLGLDIDIPDLVTIQRLFKDEKLSQRALRLHRGRNVYSATKAGLWNTLWLPFRDALTIEEPTLQMIRELLSMRTHDRGSGVQTCVDFLQSQLKSLEFEVEIHTQKEHAPILVAYRSSRGRPGQIAMYSHYDVECPDLHQWNTNPWDMKEIDGRLYGVGIGDNKATLAHRLVLLRDLQETPELVWFIQGEEEIGSPLGHKLMAELAAPYSPDLWVEENGYFDNDGTQRMLGRTIGSTPDQSCPPDTVLTTLMEQLAENAASFGLSWRHECRGLNKSFFAEGCPFNNAIPPQGRYIAIGHNDPRSNIHSANESVAMWTFAVHRRQFQTLMNTSLHKEARV